MGVLSALARHAPEQFTSLTTAPAAMGEKNLPDLISTRFPEAFAACCQCSSKAAQLLRTMTAKNDYVGKGVGPCFSVQHLSWSKCFREHVTVREVASFMVLRI